MRIGGLQVARNFATRPDLITYPLPQFSGQAAVPSSVDLYINSYKNTSVSVNPGPFTLNTVPYINGAGQATVVTTDALGRQISTTVPFYVASSLLQAGLSDFSLSAGALRQNYGYRSADYGQWVASGSGRYGVTDWLTLEGRAEGAAELAVTGAGAGVRTGQLGFSTPPTVTARRAAMPSTPRRSRPFITIRSPANRYSNRMPGRFISTPAATAIRPA